MRRSTTNPNLGHTAHSFKKIDAQAYHEDINTHTRLSTPTRCYTDSIFVASTQEGHKKRQPWNPTLCTKMVEALPHRTLHNIVNVRVHRPLPLHRHCPLALSGRRCVGPIPTSATRPPLLYRQSGRCDARDEGLCMRRPGWGRGGSL